MLLTFSRKRRRVWKTLVLVYLWMTVVGVLSFYNYIKITLFQTISNYTEYVEKHISLTNFSKFRSDIYRVNTSDLWRTGSDIDVNSKNYSELWKTVRAQVHGDYLYPRTFDAGHVVFTLRHAKIIRADLFKVPKSIKLKLTLEGGQTALFKPMLLKKHNRSGQVCNTGCEHPEYEMAAFTLNRMFDLRNMPYTAGRIISWSKELEPVASSELKQFMEVEDDQSVCFNWECLRVSRARYCFKNGDIPGAVIYFIENKVLKSFKTEDQHTKYHTFYELGVNRMEDLERLPGDKTYCKKFRQNDLYKQDTWFLDIVDMAVIDYLISHMDSRHFYISEPGRNKEPLFNVMFDYGRAFCQTHHIHALAPLIQCCKIRTRLFKAMVKFQDSLEETFVSLTKGDPLHPLLLPELMSDMKSKLKQTLAFIDFCRNFDGDSEVFVDL